MMKTHGRISLVTGPGEKMAMTNFVSTLCLVLLCSAILVGSSTLAAAQESSLDGTYILDGTDSDNINEVIETAVGEAELPEARYHSRAPRETEPRLPQGSHHFFSE
jgi:hypothetical protein